MTEIELAQHFIDAYCDFDVYKEVPMNGGRCDFVAVGGGLIIAVEVKVTMNLQLIAQAMRHRFSASFTYCAIPEKRMNNEGYALCKELGIGILLYSPEGYYRGHKKPRDHVRLFLESVYRRPKEPPRLHEAMKLSISGAQHNNMSSFRITVLEIAEILANLGGRAPLTDFFKKNGHFHYSTAASARQCIANLAGTHAIPEFRVENGFLILNSEKG
jgi:hypothetical protein